LASDSGRFIALDISVIIPTYNRASLIPETLQSILAQSYRPAEVIVIDDGSTDKTEAAVRRFGAAVRYHKIENSGQGPARNVGASLSRGAWLAFCDSDDLWCPEKLELQVRLFESVPGLEYGFTNFKIVSHGVWSEDSKFDSSPPGYWELPKSIFDEDLAVVNTPLFERILIHQPIFPSTVMMTRRFFEKVGRWGEDVARWLAEDLEFTLRCVSLAPAGVVAKPVVGIRKHAANFSADDLRCTLGEIDILRYVLDHHPAAKAYENAIREQIVSRSTSAASSAFAAGEYARVREILRAVPYSRRSWKLQIKGLAAAILQLEK